MNKKWLMALIAPFALNVYVFAFADHEHGHWDGVKPCQVWCFDAQKWKETLGYHPQWLSQKSIEIQAQCDEIFASNTPYVPKYCTFFKKL